MTKDNRFSDLVGGLRQGQEKAKSKGKSNTKDESQSISKNQHGNTVGKHRRKDFTKLTVYIPNQKHKQLKVASVLQDIEMSEIVEQALDLWFEKTPNT